MRRTVTLSLIIVFSMGALLPFATSTAHGLRQSVVAKRHRHHQYRRHSRAWWRRYRARLKRRRAAALAHRRALLAPVMPQPTGSSADLPKLPNGWNKLSVASSAEMKFRTDTDKQGIPGQAALSVVAHSRPNPGYLTAREQYRMVGGISTTDLRRIVIDKMVNSGGWVTNDYQRDIEGYRVFVVTAQTPADGRSPEKYWNFYFTEVNGRIYNLTTNTPLQFSDRMAAEAQQFIASLHATSEKKTTVK